MTIQLTRVHDRYAVDAASNAGQTWKSGGPIEPDRVLHELSKRGWYADDIIAALKAADVEWSKHVGGEVESWGDLSMRAAIEDRPVDGVSTVTPGWRFVSIGFEGDPVEIGPGVNPWKESWLSLYRWIVAAHPQYPRQRHSMETYQIAGSDPPIVFAAGEFSNGVWGFFAPLRPPRDIARR